MIDELPPLSPTQCLSEDAIRDSGSTTAPLDDESRPGLLSQDGSDDHREQYLIDERLVYPAGPNQSVQRCRLVVRPDLPMSYRPT